jgi:hypothetical protein
VHHARMLGIGWDEIAAAIAEISADGARERYGEPVPGGDVIYWDGTQTACKPQATLRPRQTPPKLFRPDGLRRGMADTVVLVAGGSEQTSALSG